MRGAKQYTPCGSLYKLSTGEAIRVITLVGDYDGYLQIEEAYLVGGANHRALTDEELEDALETNYEALHREWTEVQAERAEYRREEWAERGRYVRK